jgi:hypothetical protein
MKTLPHISDYFGIYRRLLPNIESVAICEFAKTINLYAHKYSHSLQMRPPVSLCRGFESILIKFRFRRERENEIIKPYPLALG